MAATSYGTVPVKIAETLLAATAASVTFSSIPSGFRHLIEDFQARSDQATAAMECGIQANGDAVAGRYVWERLNAVGTTVAGQDSGVGATSIAHMYVPGTSVAAGLPGHGRITILNYAGTTFAKSFKFEGGYYGGATFPLANSVAADSLFGFWAGTAAINSLVFFPATGLLIVGSLFTLQGIP
jgi:hypothetical protein